MKAWLQGDATDLRALARLLPEGRVRVFHDAGEDAYYLDTPEVGKPAEALLRRVNGLAARDPNYRAVQLTGRYTDQDGTNTHVAQVRLELRVELSMTASVVDPDGKPKPDPPSPWPAYLALADSNSDVAEVLDMMGQVQPLGWFDLFKIHEKIQESISNSIPKMGWASRADDDAFGASANR